MPGDAGGERVAVIEPRCHGLEHVPFNAALVAAILAARPESTLDVYGERTHLDELKQLLALTRGGSSHRLAWHPLEVPPRKSYGWRRAVKVRQLFASLDRAFGRCPPSGIVVATTDPLVLALVKTRLLSTWSGLPVLAVFHELLAMLGRRRRSFRSWGFAASLALPHTLGLTYLVLAKSILAELQRIAPRTAARSVAIDHPSLLSDLPWTEERPRVPPLRFGFVGGGRDAKGFEQFLDVVRVVRQRDPGIEFEVVGSAPVDTPRSALAHLTWSDRKLPLGPFVNRLRALSYIIWLGDPTHYRLVASGSLADAIALGIPVICLSGPFVDHLFEQLGEIGVRCGTLADVQREVLNIAISFSDQAYQRHVGAARAASAALAPEGCASVFRQALRLPGGCAQ